MLHYTLNHTDGLARQGTLRLNHGEIETPIFMPVGTYGAVKGMSPADLEAVGARIILGNTFHLWLRPGTTVMEKLGGLHGFNGWHRPILTDSGGFQLFSLDHMMKTDADGVTFHARDYDGSAHRWTPESNMDIQQRIGADICHLFQPQAAALGKYDNRHPAPFVLPLQTADNLPHIAQAELLKCRVAQYAAPRIENLYRLSAGIDLGIEVGRNGFGVDIKDFVQQIGA